MRNTAIALSLLFVVAGFTQKSQADNNEARVRVQLTAKHEARLASQMAGKIVSLPFALGDTFRKGQVLASFNCEHYDAELAAAKAKSAMTERTLASKQELINLQAIPELDYELAKAEQAQAQAQVLQAKAKVRDCEIYAPFSGSIVKIHVNQWETVASGTLLVHIVNQDALQVEALIPSRWLRWLEIDGTFSVFVEELQSSVEARVVGIGGRIDAVSQTVSIKAEIISDTTDLLPGMSGYALFRKPQDISSTDN